MNRSNLLRLFNDIAVTCVNKGVSVIQTIYLFVLLPHTINPKVQKHIEDNVRVH